MKTRRLLLAVMTVVLLGIGFPTEAAKGRRTVPALGEVLPAEKLREDFRILRSALEQIHPALYLYKPRENFDRLFDETAKSFDRPLTRREFYLRVSPVVEKVKCGHTYFDLHQRLLNQMMGEAMLFPLPLIFLNRKAYVDFGGAEIPLGAQIVAINDRPMAEVLPQLLPFIRSDGNNRTMKFRMLADEFPLHHRLVFGASDEFKIKFLSFGKTEPAMKTLKAMVGVELEKRFERRHSTKGKQKNYSFEWVNENTGLLTANSFEFGVRRKGRRKYRDFLNTTFAAMKARPTARNLIIDVRINEGGYVGYDALLFSYLAQKEFRDCKSAMAMTVDIPLEQFLDKLEFSKGVEKSIERSLEREFKIAFDSRYYLVDKKNKLRQPKPGGFKGDLFFLTSGLTHSGGAVLCSYALNNDNAVFIGQETGGGHEFYSAGNMAFYTLPNTGCQIEVPMIRYQNEVPAKVFPKGSGIRPHHRVVQSQADFIKGRDTVLQFALDLIKKSEK
jgi:hypothetical protein